MPEEINYIWLFYGMLPIVAFFYAAVGHGGASGYLALMALFSFSPLVMKPTALMLNLFVAAIAFYHFWREGYFKHQLFFSFAISSIPLSFLGGTMDVEESMYKKILAVLLVFAILRMLFVVEKRQGQAIKIKFWQGGIIGGCIGFLGFNGDFNHAIIIRSFLSKNNLLFYQAGAGIVMKSNDESERQEVFNKLAALHKAIEIAEEL